MSFLQFKSMGGKPMLLKMLRIGLIGAGWHATADHAPALRHCADSDEFHGRVELSGVCDRDRAKATGLAERFGFRRVYESIEAMLAEVDAVLSIVPPGALATVLETIMQHSRPVLIEKPLGRGLTEARRIAAMLAGYPHMVSLNRRFDPAVQIARQWIAKQPSPPRLFIASMIRRDRLEADFAWSTGIHLTDLLCFLLGPLKLTRGPSGVERFGIVGGDVAIKGSIEISPAGDRVEECVRVIGADPWYVHIDTGTHQPWQVWCNRGEDTELDETGDPATPTFIRNGTADETTVFLRGVLSGDIPGPTVAAAMPGTELAAAMQALNDAPPYHVTIDE